MSSIINAALAGPKTRGLLLQDKVRHLRRQADAKRELKSYKSAASLYEAVLELQPRAGPMHVQCAHMHKEAGNLRKAEDHYLAAKALMPHDGDLRLQLGHFFKVAGRHAEAITAYRQAAALVPGWAEPLNELASLVSHREHPVGSRGWDAADARFGGEVDVAHLLDTDFYAEQAGASEDPVAHYKELGWKRGFDPSPLFSTSYYLRCLQRPLEGDPLTDFAVRGAGELAEVHPLLDVQRYNRLSAEAREVGVHPFLHYLWRKGGVGIDAFRLFDAAYYLEQCPGLLEAGFSPLSHYLRFGWKEGRKPHREVSPELLSRLAGLEEGVEPLTVMVSALVTASGKSGAGAIDTSVIILNLSKSVLTLQCLFVLGRHTDMAGVEVIVIDNGSTADQFRILADYARHHKLIRSDVNLGFGEANNVGAEAATGRHLVFLNNDAFVTAGWLPPLLAAVAEEGVGAAGPMFLYPDGRLQEAGATVGSDGHVHQKGRGLSEIHPRYLSRCTVDYTSAATILVKADLFSQILGFDLIWDPAYYEDVDTCLKMKVAGFKVVYEPSSRVYHLENSTSSDLNLNLQLDTVVAANRVKFVQRWGDYLDRPDPSAAPPLLRPQPQPRAGAPRPLLALFTPFPLNPGGGERYLLSFADAFREEFDCILYTPQHTSRVRILTMGRELGLSLDHVQCVRWQDAGRQPSADVFVSMGNEVLPSAPAIGKQNFYVCQFPFPMQGHHYVRDWQKIDGYDGVLVYSPFVKAAYGAAAESLGLSRPPVSVVGPAVLPVAGARRAPGGPRKMLNVGRFHPGGHCKRQDVMVEVFKELLSASPEPLELHLAGALGGEAVARAYFADLQRAARDLPVHFHVNNGLGQLADLFLEAEVYWHATGINDDVASRPERFEHFGITIVEAMSAGAVPVVLSHGGPGALIEDGRNGFLVRNRAELRDVTARVLALPRPEIESIGREAQTRAMTYSPAIFKESLTQLFAL